ncbi:MAG: His/Gly/Thr/Pro-type tRNA ligase C-terminal domain-containing protein, partial [Planctomycetota bacterium]
AGIGVELYPDPKRLGQQLKYADAQGFRLAIVAGGDEWQQSKVQVKSLADKQTFEVDYCHESPQPLIERLRELL